MKPQTMFFLNLALTCLTCAVLIFSCGGCTEEQLTKAGIITGQVKTVAAGMAPVAEGQPWYVLMMIGLDIASSGVAAYVAYKKGIVTTKVSE